MAGQQQHDAAALAALTAAYQRQIVQQRNSLEAFIRRLWRSLDSYRETQIQPFVTQVTPAVAGAQQNVATLTAGYLASFRQRRLGGRLRLVPVDPRRVTGPAVRNGTPPATVYERPFHLVWRQLGAGVDPAEAIQAGLDRALQSAATDLQLTKAHTARAVLADDKTVSGYRRVLEGAHSCGLCVVASTQRYRRSDLLPMHPACDCSVAPLFGDDQHVIDEERLAAAHDAIKKTFGVSSADARTVNYRDLLVVHEHGEFGPVLARRGAPFLGPHDL